MKKNPETEQMTSQIDSVLVTIIKQKRNSQLSRPRKIISTQDFPFFRTHHFTIQRFNNPLKKQWQSANIYRIYKYHNTNNK